MAFQRLRGFRDVYGEEAALFARIDGAARTVFERFGFEEMRTPILEERELFKRALGVDTDVVQKEMYEFTDRSKTAVALRPEATAGVVRAYLENNFHKTKGLAKFYYSGPMFRSERPQAGRLRQFHQVGVEQLGTESPYADAETIHCLALFLDALGIGGYEVRLNNLGTFEEREKFKAKLKSYFEPKKSRLCEDCRTRLEKNVLRILDCKVVSCRAAATDAPSIGDFLNQESKDHHGHVRQALDAAGVKYAEDPRRVRGLDYYTRTVFEVTHPKLGAQDAIAAGGRYDQLIESFGGSKAGAVGFAVGVERLAMCLSDTKREKVDQLSVFIAAVGDAGMKEGFKMLSGLRKAGLQAFMDFSLKSLKGQMRLADKMGCEYAVVIGEDEITRKKCIIKLMRGGPQIEREMDVEVIAEQIKRLAHD